MGWILATCGIFAICGAVLDWEANDIVVFLGSLTGELSADYIQPPVLSVSTNSTPLADPTYIQIPRFLGLVTLPSDPASDVN